MANPVTIWRSTDGRDYPTEQEAEKADRWHVVRKAFQSLDEASRPVFDQCNLSTLESGNDLYYIYDTLKRHPILAEKIAFLINATDLKRENPPRG